LVWHAGNKDAHDVAKATAERLSRKLIVLTQEPGLDNDDKVASWVHGLASGGEGSSGVVVGLEVSEALLSSSEQLTKTLQAQPFTVNLFSKGDTPATLAAAKDLTSYDLPVGPDTPHDSSSTHSPFSLADQVDGLLALYRSSQAYPPTTEDTALDMGHNTFFLSLTYPDIRDALTLLPKLEAGVDALELRVDLLRDHSEWSVLRQLAILRKHSPLPVIFTVRSKGQCGAFADEPVPLFNLLESGLRAGVEILDVEANWPMSFRDQLLTKAEERYRATTRLLGSYHVVGKYTGEEEARRLFTECYHGGRVDAVKVVLTAFSARDNYLVHEIAASMGFPCPYIALCLGEKGKLSRVLNSRYTPVTSDFLPSAAAPGQLSSPTLMRLRHELGLVPARSFYLLGNPISKSPSPIMHNSAFKDCQLPHAYGLFETEDVEDFKTQILTQPTFGGASVTIPHKQTIMPFLDRIEVAAKEIGAVNTIMIEEGPTPGQRRLVGDNTDWLGIKRPVLKRLQRRGKDKDPASRLALVVGGGGTALAAAYAMRSCGFRLAVFNRTPSKAKEIAERFGGTAVEALTPSAFQELLGQQNVDVVISTIPSTAGFTLPDFLLEKRPLIMDVAYRPALTPLLEQAQAAGCDTIQGADMLVEQGIEQFQRWTGRRAPSKGMRDAVYSMVERVTPPFE